MKKLNKKYADLLHQASIATGRKEAVGLLHKAAKLQTKFDEKSNLQKQFVINFLCPLKQKNSFINIQLGQ